MTAPPPVPVPDGSVVDMPAVDTIGGLSMGTSWSVRLVAPRRDLHALHAGVQAQLDRVVAEMSNWAPDSVLSGYNAAPAGSAHALPAGFRRVLDASLEIAAASNGAFDPTVGPLVDLWGFGPSGARAEPAPGSIAAPGARPCWRDIAFDAKGRLVQPGGLHLDFCAIAKGHAVDAAAAWLRDAGIDSALVDVGGELSGFGRKPDGTPWRVLVEGWDGDLDDAREPRVIALDGRALATSGERWHSREIGGRRRSHTLDPRTGAPVVDAPIAVTVAADTAMHADAWATALTVLGVDAGFALACERGLAVRFIADAVRDHEERMTPAFEAWLEA